MIEPLGDLVDDVLEALASIGPAALAVITGLLLVLETTILLGLLVPGDVIVLLAGSTADSPGRYALVLCSAAAGTFLGQVCGYALGREVGPWLRASRVGRLLGEHRWTRAEDYLAGRGAWMLVPARFVSVVHSVVPVVAGTVRMPFGRFAFWAALGAVIWASVYTSLGAAAGAAYREYGHLGLITTVLLLGAAAGAMALRSHRARRRPRANRRRRLRRRVDRSPAARSA